MPNILDTAAIVALQAQSQGRLHWAYSTLWVQEEPKEGFNRGGGGGSDGVVGWSDMGGGIQRSPRIQERTYHLCWKLDNSRATYTLGGQ